MFFSILIPTKNRHYLLDQAIDILTQSSFRDFEIVVSDDSDDPMQSQLVCEKHSNKNKDIEIKYVRPTKRISMIDNFNHALSWASGEYILVLYDDDAIMPSALGYLYQLIVSHQLEVVVTQMSLYYHTDMKDSSVAGAFSHISHTGNLFKVRTQAYIDLIAGFNQYDHALVMPKSGNCAIKKSIFEECRAATQSDFFTTPFPDYPTACHIAGVRDYIHIVDLPLYIGGTSAPSNSAMFYDRKNKWEKYLQLIDENMLSDSPCPLRYITYPYIEFMLRKFKKLYPNSFELNIDYKEFYKSIYNEFMVIQKHGEDVSEEINILKKSMYEMFQSNEYYDQLTKLFQQNSPVVGVVTNTKSFLRKALKWLLQKNDIIFTVLSNLNRTMNKGKRHIYRHYHFSSIVEAAKFFDPYLQSYCINVENLKLQKIESAKELVSIIHH